MKILCRICQIIGFMFFTLGISAGDSQSLIIPLIMALTGIALIAFWGYVEDWLKWDQQRERGNRNDRHNNL